MDQRVSTLMKSQRKNNKGKRKSGNNSLKVVYISSPMKVKTSASKFRSLVQQLTGKNSDISQYMDSNNHDDLFREFDCDDGSLVKETSDNQGHQVFSSSDDTPTSSDSFLGPMDNVLFSSQMKEQFEGIFSGNLFYEPCQLDILGSYQELL